MAAAHVGNAQAVRALIARGADVNAREKLRKQTALMWAAANSHTEVVRVLLEARADLAARTDVRTMVVNSGLQGGGANDVADRYNPGGVADEKQGGFTALLFAASQGSFDSARLLIEAGANVNDAAANGASALVIAAHSGHPDVAELLLQRGADPNAAGAGYTALHAALLRGQSDLIKSLLAHKADPNAVLEKGTHLRRSSIDWSMSFSWVGGTPIWLAAKLGDPDAMRVIAASGGNIKTAQPDGTTPLMAALSPRPNRRGLAAPDPAEIERQTLETVRAALDLGDDANAVVSPTGNTPLHTAAAAGQTSIVQLLVDRGAKLDARNKKGQSALQLAIGSDSSPDAIAKSPRKTTIELLKKLGAPE
jgi:ankyrin repeat protein